MEQLIDLIFKVSRIPLESLGRSMETTIAWRLCHISRIDASTRYGESLVNGDKREKRCGAWLSGISCKAKLKLLKFWDMRVLAKIFLSL